MIRRSVLAALAAMLCTAAACADTDLDQGFANPPLSARVRNYWCWLNGNVNKAAITKDLEWMKRIGMGGGLIFDCDGAADVTPIGPTYGSPAWRELFRHAVHTADRLGLKLSLSPQSGWNLGGPGVTPGQALKHITWSALDVKGPVRCAALLPVPPHRLDFYRDTFVLAYRLKDMAAGQIPAPEVTASLNVITTWPDVLLCGYGPGFFDVIAAPLEGLLYGCQNGFWLLGGNWPGQAPSPERPQWLQLAFCDPPALGALWCWDERATRRGNVNGRRCRTANGFRRWRSSPWKTAAKRPSASPRSKRLSTAW